MDHHHWLIFKMCSGLLVLKKSATGMSFWPLFSLPPSPFFFRRICRAAGSPTFTGSSVGADHDLLARNSIPLFTETSTHELSLLTFAQRYVSAPSIWVCQTVFGLPLSGRRVPTVFPFLPHSVSRQ